MLDKIKICPKVLDKVTKELFARYTKCHGYSLSKLLEKSFLSTSDYDLEELKYTKGNYTSFRTTDYFLELEARGLMSRDNLRFNFTSSGYNKGYKLTHPYKSFIAENQNLVITIITSIITTIATVTVTLWSGVFAV